MMEIWKKTFKKLISIIIFLQLASLVLLPYFPFYLLAPTEGMVGGLQSVQLGMQKEELK